MLLRDQDGRARQAPGAQVVERLVGILQWVLPDVRLQRNVASDLHEFQTVLTCQIGDGPNDPLLPQESIRKRGYIAHVDAGAHDDAAGYDARQRLGYESADGREDERSVE